MSNTDCVTKWNINTVLKLNIYTSTCVCMCVYYTCSVPPVVLPTDCYCVGDKVDKGVSP